MSLYHTLLSYENVSSLRFLAASMALHLMVFFILNLAPQPGIVERSMIPVSLLETPEKSPAAPPPVTKATRRSPLHSRTMIAKQDAPRAVTKGEPAKDAKQAQNEIARPEAPLPDQPLPIRPPREIIPERSIVAERALPGMKDLLPPANWSSSSRNNTPVSLNTSDPVYVSYFTKVKQLIEAHWEYPELALRYGLEGRLSLEFTIGANGQLERLRVVRSSGSQLLDDEALRAIRAASPFPPIPPWIKPNPLSISAAMEYHDNRVNYQPPR
jgi:protein TonB